MMFRDILNMWTDSFWTGVGQRFVSEASYQKWKREIDLLRLDPVQLKLKKKQEPNLIDDKAGEMEVGLSLLGGKFLHT